MTTILYRLVLRVQIKSRPKSVRLASLGHRPNSTAWLPYGATLRPRPLGSHQTSLDSHRSPPMPIDPSLPRPTAASPLKFDATVEQPPSQSVCAVCGAALRATYHMLGDSMICGRCRSQHETAMGGAGAHRFARALLFGVGAAVVGAAIYYAILAATGYSIGIIAIFVGYLVGRAVNVGSKGKGGRKYQLLAALLTYFAISSTYLVEGLRQIGEERSNKSADTTSTIAGTTSATSADSAETDEYQEAETSPDVMGTSGKVDSAAGSRHARPSGSVLILLVAILTLLLLAPILAGFSSPILLLILGFGVFQAWKMNRGISADLTGPFNLRTAPLPPAQA